MLSPNEAEEIRQIVHHELADIERQVAHNAGSYNYLCSCGGLTLFSHRPIGQVIRSIHHEVT